MNVFYSGLILAWLTGPMALAWNWGDQESANNPAIFEKDYEYHYSLLPKAGSIKIPWSETYWPSKIGSLNYRWNSKKYRKYGYVSPSREELRKMPLEALKELSPSEKYDLAMGHYDYPFHQLVDQEMADTRALNWEGLCNGWAPASLYYTEPKPVNITNPEGLVIPFGASDVKALLSYFIAVTAEKEAEVSQIGLRCESSRIHEVGPDECDDINAGALHVVLANEIGKRGRGFVADISRTREVWNQPVYGYEMTEIGSARSREKNGGVRIRTKIFFGKEIRHSLWEPTAGTDANQMGTQIVEYILELDQNDRIVGGEWISKKFHPDFIWRVNNIQSLKFHGALEGLNQIYRP